jgi:Asp-tRNA(Asn)/Glu-tRNA(Gln) amidotransferase A subunit family amidase
MRAAFSLDLGYAQVDPEVSEVIESAVAALQSSGMEIRVLDTLFSKDPLDEFFTMTNSYYAKTMESLAADPRWNKVDEGIREQVKIGLRTSAVEFLRASDLSFYLNQTLYRLFQEVDILISPTTAGLPPSVGGVQMIAGREVRDWVQLTYPFNMTRSPAASVCAGISRSGLPVGLQIVGPHLGDLRVLSAAQFIEERLGTFRPPTS